jgi:cytidyltransferase-like protein
MFRLIAIAGTFDRLHKGHRFFISQAFKFSKKAIIGLTSDEYVKRKFRIHPSVDGSEFRIKTESDKYTWKVAEGLPGGGGIRIKTYQERKRELREFLREKGLLERTRIVKIDDVYGPAIEDNDIEALVVTSETMKGGRLVNQKRQEKGLKRLKLLRVSIIPAYDRKRIASTRIRLGEIDRWGRVYANVTMQQCNNATMRGRDKYKISEELRQELKKPQGILIKGNPENHKELADELKKIVTKFPPVMIATVGDEVTKLCNQVGIKPDLAIIDYHVMRQRKYYSLADLGLVNSCHSRESGNPAGSPIRSGMTGGVKVTNRDSPGVEGSRERSLITVKNPPGNITPTLFAAIKRSIKSYLANGRQRIIKVLGEEDLAGVPAMLLSPLGSVVLYGQPQEGLVVVEIIEEKKEELLLLIQKYP